MCDAKLDANVGEVAMILRSTIADHEESFRA